MSWIIAIGKLVGRWFPALINGMSFLATWIRATLNLLYEGLQKIGAWMVVLLGIIALAFKFVWAMLVDVWGSFIYTGSLIKDKVTESEFSDGPGTGNQVSDWHGEFIEFLEWMNYAFPLDELMGALSLVFVVILFCMTVAFISWVWQNLSGVT